MTPGSPRRACQGSAPHDRQHPLEPPSRHGDAVYGLGYDSTLHRSTGLGKSTLLQKDLGTVVGLAAGDGVVVLPRGEGAACH